MKRMPKWTEADKNFLRASLGQIPLAVIAATLGRTPNACQVKAWDMGLTGVDHEANERLDKVIRERFSAGGAPAVLAIVPDISERTVRRRANALGIRHSEQPFPANFTHIVKPQGSWERTPVKAPTSVFDLATV